MGEMEPVTQLCSVMGIQGLARLIFGKKGEPRRIKGKGLVLISLGVSSLVIDSLCDQARGLGATVACLYFDFAAQQEQSSTSMLRTLLKQLVAGLREIPAEIVEAYETR